MSGLDLEEAATSMVYRIKCSLIGTFLGFCATSLCAAPQTAWGDTRLEVVAVGVNQSFDTSLITLKFPEQAAGNLVDSLVEGEEARAGRVLRSPTAEEFEKTMQSDSTTDVLVIYWAGVADDTGFYFANRRMDHHSFGKLIAHARGRKKIVILDRYFIGHKDPRTTGFRSELLPKVDANGEPIVYLTSDADQLSAFENSMHQGLTVTNALLFALNGRADRKHDGIITWAETVSRVEQHLRFRPGPMSTGRVILDSAGRDAQIQLIHLSRDKANRGAAMALKANLDRDVAPPAHVSVWGAAVNSFEPMIELGMHKGWRPAEQAAIRYGMSICAFRHELLAGSWCIPAAISYQSHVSEVEDATGTTKWTTLSTGVRGRYVFNWGWQDLRPQLLVGQARGEQVLAPDERYGAMASAAWAPHMAVGLSTHFYAPKWGFHFGPYYRQETLYTKSGVGNEQQLDRYKTTVLGLELSLGELSD